MSPEKNIIMQSSKTSKIIILVEFLLIIALLAVLLTRYISLSDVKPVVRTPNKPGESTLAYTPPPPPKVQIKTIKTIAKIRKLFAPTMEKISDDIYLARGFGTGSIMMVITDEGLVIIDTSEAQVVAKEVLAEFRKITDKPVKYIIYTHAHIDHIYGSPVFMENDTQVIATNKALEMMQQDLGWFSDYHDRSRDIQTGKGAPDYAKKLPFKSPFKHDDKQQYVKPTISFDEEYAFELGGKRFELYHTIGETPGHLMVWMPEEKALFSGDLYYESFPNLSTPMFESRQVKGWYESLDRMLQLNAHYLIPSHTLPVVGEEKIRDILIHHSQGIRYVYDETIKAINTGKSVEEAVATIKLPEALAARSHLKEGYGRVDWSVRGIYRNMTGWYDGKGTGLSPLPPQHRATELVNLSGGAAKILTRAIELQKAGEHQLVTELCDVVIQANPEDKLAHIIKAYSLDYLGIQGGNLNMFGFYRSAAAMERKAAGIKP